MFSSDVIPAAPRLPGRLWVQLPLARSSGPSSDLNFVSAREMLCVPARASALDSALTPRRGAPRPTLLYEAPRQAACSPRSQGQGAPWVPGPVALLGGASVSSPGSRGVWFYWPVCLSVPCLVAARIPGRGHCPGQHPVSGASAQSFSDELKAKQNSSKVTHRPPYRQPRVLSTRLL